MTNVKKYLLVALLKSALKTNNGINTKNADPVLQNQALTFTKRFKQF